MYTITLLPDSLFCDSTGPMGLLLQFIYRTCSLVECAGRLELVKNTISSLAPQRLPGTHQSTYIHSLFQTSVSMVLQYFQILLCINWIIIATLLDYDRSYKLAKHFIFFPFILLSYDLLTNVLKDFSQELAKIFQLLY